MPISCLPVRADLPHSFFRSDLPIQFPQMATGGAAAMAAQPWRALLTAALEAEDLKSDPKNEFLSALRAITKCITCPAKYFEKTIRLAVNKMGTDEGAITRVIITRAEVDMKLIKELYFKRNGVPLIHAIKKDTTGDYEDFIVAIVGEESA